MGEFLSKLHQRLVGYNQAQIKKNRCWTLHLEVHNKYGFFASHQHIPAETNGCAGAKKDFATQFWVAKSPWYAVYDECGKHIKVSIYNGQVKKK